jgi:hypothetical protein
VPGKDFVGEDGKNGKPGAHGMPGLPGKDYVRTYLYRVFSMHSHFQLNRPLLTYFVMGVFFYPSIQIFFK